MRLSKEEIEKIKEIIKKIDNDAEILIFRSQVDDNKKGGDIDILIISDKVKREDIIVDLYEYFGFRKIDILITDNIEKSPFYKHAYESGVKI